MTLGSMTDSPMPGREEDVVPSQEPPASPPEKPATRGDAFERLSRALQGLDERIPGEASQSGPQKRTYAKEPELDKALTARRRADEATERAENTLPDQPGKDSTT